LSSELSIVKGDFKILVRNNRIEEKQFVILIYFDVRFFHCCEFILLIMHNNLSSLFEICLLLGISLKVMVTFKATFLVTLHDPHFGRYI